MRCGTSFFNATVYKSSLRRFWPVWAGLALILILMLPLPVLNAWSADRALDVVLGVGSYGAVVLTFGFSAVAAMTVYGWMYNAKSTGFTAALPLRREGMFLSCALAGYTMLALPGLIAALLTLLSGASQSLLGFAASAALVGQWLAKYLLLSLLFFGFASLCAQLTGTLWVLPVVYGLLNAAVVVLWLLISNVLTNLLPGYAGEVPQAAYILSPLVRVMMFEWDVSSHFPNWAGLSLYAAFGLLCAALGLVLAKRRRMESATDTVAVEWLKPVFRWVFSVGFALCFSNLLYLLILDDEPYLVVPMTLFLLLGAFLGWLIAEMLVRKSYKVASSLKTFPILALLIIVLTVGCHLGGFGYSSRIPAPERVKSAKIEVYGYSCVTNDPSEIPGIQALHRELAAAQPGQMNGRDVYIEYELTSGGALRRRYSVTGLSEEGQQELRQMVERELAEGLELILSRNDRTLDSCFYATLYQNGEYYNFDLSEEQGRELLRSGVLPDYHAGTLRLVSGWAFGPASGSEEPKEYCYLNYDAWVRDDGGYAVDYRSRMYYQFQVTPAAKNTWELLGTYRREAEAKEKLG